jgi:flagellar hook protein FlgE
MLCLKLGTKGDHVTWATTMSLASVLQTATSGMSGAVVTLEAASNNLANSRTNGFKQSRPIFATQPVNTLGPGSGPSATNGGTNPVEIGTGVSVVGIATDYSQGPLVVSSNSSDDTSTSPVPGTVELANTDVARNLVDLLLSSNSFRANAAVFGTADHLLDELTNLRRNNA